MGGVCAICQRELRSFFVSPVAYFVITGFLLLAGYFFFNMLTIFNMVLARYSMMPTAMGEAPNLNQYVIEGYFHTLLVVLVFLVPLLTMRTIAEEKRSGTFELLMTSPLSVTSLVVGKFLSLAVIIAIMMVLVGIFPGLLIAYGNPEVPPMLSGLLAVTLCALAFASVGMAVSSFTENQIVAGVSSMVVLLLFYVIHSPADSLGGMGREVLHYLSPVMQTEDMIKGVIATDSLIYFCSVILLGLFLSTRALEAHRWR